MFYFVTLNLTADTLCNIIKSRGVKMHPFRKWLREHKIPERKAAESLGMPYSTLRCYLILLRKTPPVVARRFRKFTNEELPLEAFLFPEDYMTSAKPVPPSSADDSSIETETQLNPACFLSSGQASNPACPECSGCSACAPTSMEAINA